MRSDTRNALDERFGRYPFLRAGIVDPVEIDEASAAVGLPFPEAYREFLAEHGAAIVGPYPIFGLRPVEDMGGDWSVVELNRRYRSDRWRGVEDWVIVSADHAGNPFGIDRSGRVWISDHDSGAMHQVAESFEEFLRTRCLGLPHDP
jgi:hypothetical protein